MSHLDALIAEHCLNGVPFQLLGAVAPYSDTRIDATELDETTFIGVDNLLSHKGGKVDASYLPNTKRLTAYQEGDVLLGNIRPYLKKVWLATNGGGCSGDVLALRVSPGYRERLLPEFLYYLLSSEDFFAYDMQHAKGAKMPRGDKASILKYRIPIPPVEVQREVLRVLDLFTELEVELEAELEGEVAARQAQHAHYRSQILGLTGSANLGDNEVPLSELVEFINGKPHERLVVPDGSITLLTARFISTAGRFARWVNPEDALTPARRDDIAMVMSDLPNGRALARCFYVGEDGKHTANQRVCLLRVRDEKTLSARYLYHFLDRNPQLLAFDNGQDQTHLKKGQILGIQVPLTSLAAQDRATATLDTLDGSTRDLISDLESELNARRKQYEHYRERLLTFEELAA